MFQVRCSPRPAPRICSRSHAACTPRDRSPPPASRPAARPAQCALLATLGSARTASFHELRSSGSSSCTHVPATLSAVLLSVCAQADVWKRLSRGCRDLGVLDLGALDLGVRLTSVRLSSSERKAPSSSRYDVGVPRVAVALGLLQVGRRELGRPTPVEVVHHLQGGLAHGVFHRDVSARKLAYVLAVCSLPTRHCPLTTAQLRCAVFRNDLERIKASLGLPKYTVGLACYP